MDRIRLARSGVPPELPEGGCPANRIEAMPHPLHLTAAEVEVMLCFTLSSPLHYGSVEESLCDKLHHHLRGLYAWGAVPAADCGSNDFQTEGGTK